MPSRLPTPAITSGLPSVTVIVPCRNEAKWIAECMESIRHNDYPKERLEVLIVDGMSDDGTRPIVEDFSAGHPWLRMLDNPRRTTPAALNTGIAAAQGDVIIRMDAHSEYPANYIGKLVYWLEKSGADNVGGLWIMRPANNTPTARALPWGSLPCLERAMRTIAWAPPTPAGWTRCLTAVTAARCSIVSACSMKNY